MEARKEPPEPYPYGSRGPAGSDHLAKKYGYTKFGGGIHPYADYLPTSPPHLLHHTRPHLCE